MEYEHEEPHAPATDADSPHRQAENSTRRTLQWDAIVGFLSFFAVVAVVQAFLNVLAPEPQIFPAVLALVLVVAAVSAWRYSRARR